MIRFKRLLPLVLVCLLAISTNVAAQKEKGCNISISVKDKSTKEPIIMATCVLNPLSSYAATDLDGNAVIKNIPKGKYTLEVSYVGYETKKIDVQVTKDMTLQVPLTETSLALGEVTVLARQNAAGTSTSSKIGRQAIDHLQASSLADVMQLIPGQLMTKTDLTIEHPDSSIGEQQHERIRFEHRG